MRQESDDDTTYRVVLDGEEQYAIWPAHKAVPAGWRDGGKVGSRTECLSFIESVWTDMRPLSLRKKMDSGAS